jgi:hypothetical protein
MGRGRRMRWLAIRRGAAAALAIALLGACRDRQAGPPYKARAATQKPLDRLLPGELAEGKEQVMGLRLPREVRLERVFDDSAVARGRVAADALAAYVRQRVKGASVELGQSRIVFSKAHPSGAAEGKIVRIEILEEPDTTALFLTDTTPPAIPFGLSEDERWRKAGVRPGKPFEPNAL